MRSLKCFKTVVPLVLATGMFTASLCAASPVQISVHPPFVRIGETARVDVTWQEKAPENAKLECTASNGSVRAADGGYLFTPPDKAGRAFVHLVVREGEKVIAESAVPVLVYRQIVLLKADDFCATPPDRVERWRRYVDEVVVHRGIKTSLGVIGERVEQPSPEFARWVDSWKAGGLVEFFIHGYDHGHYVRENPLAKIVWESMTPEEAQGVKKPPEEATFEFQGRPMEEQLAHLAATQQIVQNVFGIRMRSFGASFNKWDQSTVEAMGELGQNIDVWFAGSQASGLFIIPRGGGEIENKDGVPDAECYRKIHDPSCRMIFLQHHPPFEPFTKGWNQFLEILDIVAAEGGVFMLPGECADLFRDGTLPLEPRAEFPDPALECALRMAAHQWERPLDGEDRGKISSLEWCWREPRIRSLAGLEKCTRLRSLDLRGNAVTDVKPLTKLWLSVNQEINAELQGNPLPERFLCDEVPKLTAQGLKIHGSGACDNVLLTLHVDGQGTLEPRPGNYTYPRGSAVTLRAKPRTGWRVGSWEGAPGLEQKEQVDVELPGYCVITVHFVPADARKPEK